MPRLNASLIFAAALLFAVSGSPLCQAQEQAGHGTVQHIQIHGKLLEGNLEGDSPDRDVAVYLPPSYSSSGDRRYPVIYLLHGFTGKESSWFTSDKGSTTLDQAADRQMASGKVREMIIVAPNAYTRFHGSFYSDSATTGDWEDFIATEVVAYIDSHYRTLARVESRGLAGHSMGGYGTVRIGMKHPDVFSSIYAMSPCCLLWGPGFQPTGDGELKAHRVHSFAQVEKVDFQTLAALALSAAWSPDPKRPPLYLDLPTVAGRPDQGLTAKYSANLPLAMLDQYVPNLRRLHAIGFEVGTRDDFPHIPYDVKLLDRALTKYAIAHTYETYDGTHTSRIPERLEMNMLPFFSKNLQF